VSKRITEFTADYAGIQQTVSNHAALLKLYTLAPMRPQ